MWLLRQHKELLLLISIVYIKMNILIIEDEPHAARQLKDMVAGCRADAVFCPIIDSVEDAITYLRAGHPLDLIFLDVHLSDGQAFEIFDAVETFAPVIFTTAYDQYAIKAFEVNSVDYLLKPVSKEKVSKALAKYERQVQDKYWESNHEYIRRLQNLLSNTKVYKGNFLIPFKDKLLPVPIKDFAWFEIKNGVVVGTKFDKTSLILEERSLEEIGQMIDPSQFYRANRQYLVNRLAIKEVAQYFNGKLLAILAPAPPEPVVVSRDKALQFKKWMGS